MAGSYNHVTQYKDGKAFFIGHCLIDGCSGDALEAMEELWFLVHYFAKDDNEAITKALKEFNYPSDPLASDLRQRQRDAIQADYWEGSLDAVFDDKYTPKEHPNE